MPSSPVSRRWCRRSRVSPRFGRCGAPHPICSTSTSATRRASAFSRDASGAAIPRRSTRRYGFRTCAALPRTPSGCRHRRWSICSIRYFDCQVPAIVENGGEVLKFMGDGLLAIFPISADQADADDVCGRALVAATRGPRTGDCAWPIGWHRWRRWHEFRIGASCRRGALWQYRQRQSAGFYLHRSCRKSGGAP